jgi:hypothetical protein
MTRCVAFTSAGKLLTYSNSFTALYLHLQNANLSPRNDCSKLLPVLPSSGGIKHNLRLLKCGGLTFYVHSTHSARLYCVQWLISLHAAAAPRRIHVFCMPPCQLWIRRSRMPCAQNLSFCSMQLLL